MTVEKLIRILRENDIPEDAILMRDSGWKYRASDMDGLYYCTGDNTVVLTQNYAALKYNENPDWVKIGLKEEWIFTRIYFDSTGNEKYIVECPSCHERWKTSNELKWKKYHGLCPNCGVRKANLWTN